MQSCQFKETDQTILSKYKLDNYNILPHGQSRQPCNTKGGLIIYINDTFKGAHTKTQNTFLTWEGQVVKVNEGGLKKKNYQYISTP